MHDSEEEEEVARRRGDLGGTCDGVEGEANDKEEEERDEEAEPEAEAEEEADEEEVDGELAGLEVKKLKIVFWGVLIGGTSTSGMEMLNSLISSSRTTHEAFILGTIKITVQNGIKYAVPSVL